ncbi:MAG: hypothetical protein Q8M01_08220 [Rubrivivax sp.]|nr:hypothetical protein [Rubrivivax sp.]
MFRDRRQLRRWAARVLVLWLFGVAAGVAHACLAPSVTGLSAPGSASSAGLEVAHHGPAAALEASHHERAADHGTESPDKQEPTANSNCQDFCDKATVSIPQQKSALDEVHGHALLPRAASAGLAVPPLAGAQPWVPRRDGVWLPPIRITFLRLAL